ncbi:DUF4367 domain-containing protein [Brevibacillus ruminantium]|uniref:DUF4367 domain-containing protein n=1 Tax=Brevibacillus ruminantium TaxID=2950604 RepID=A0ABY4WHM3_9BACL|nr:DUF4367 domain-containing protein [Brevibacillus ruminantium]USG66643.1 DUF4367 domain-containing protein [Brevibacillus ruminantium]
MNKDHPKQRFLQDVDQIIQGKQLQKSQDTSPEYDEIMELCSALREIDIPLDKETRERIRDKAGFRPQSNTDQSAREDMLMRKIFGSRFVAGKVAAVAIVAILGASMFSEPLRALAYNASLSISKIVQLGYSSVMQVDPTEESDTAQPTADHAENVKISTVDKTGQVETDISYISYASLAEAQNHVGFKLKGPAYLPAGYAFTQAKGFEGADEYMNLYFNDGSKREIVLFQRIMNEETAFGLATSDPVETVEINGVKGAWMESGTLMWEKDGVSYTLVCKGIGKEEAMKIAKSIE